MSQHLCQGLGGVAIWTTVCLCPASRPAYSPRAGGRVEDGQGAEQLEEKAQRADLDRGHPE